MSKKTKILPTREELEGAVRGGGRKLPLTTQLAILPFEDKREAYIKLVNKLQKAGHFKEVQALEKEHGIRSANFHQLAGAGIGGAGSTSGVFGDIFGDFIPFVPNNPAPKSDFGNIATGTTPKLRRNLERALPILAQLGDKYNIPIGNSKVRSVVEQLIPALPSIDSPLVKKPEATKPRIQDTTPETPEPKVADPETAQKASGRTKITETPIDSPPSALGGGTEGKESTGIEQKTAPSSDPSPDDPIPVPADEPIPDVDKDSEPDKKEKRRRRPPIPFRDTDSEPDEEDEPD
ncbi:MAG: hypothetical protein ACXAAH_16465, partial [Promethearchaeota archaeon]